MAVEPERRVQPHRDPRRVKERIEPSLGSEMPAVRAADHPKGQRTGAPAASVITSEVPAAPSSQSLPRQPPGPTVTAPLPAAASERPAFFKRTSLQPERPRPADPAPASLAPAPSPPGPAPESLGAAPTPAGAVAAQATSAPPAAAAPAGPPDAPEPVTRLLDAARTDSATTVIGPGALLRSRYELQGLLGYGGMASVFKAVDRYRARLGLQNCCVALKIVASHPPNLAHVAALGREFHNAQQLSHPNIINVYEIDHEGDASFYTMELLEGEQLNQLQERIGGLLAPRYALAIIRDIGEAIAHAHSRGVVHADLKPQNIFVTYGGQIRLLDFGGLSPSPDLPDLGPRASLAGLAARTPPTDGGAYAPMSREPWIADSVPLAPQSAYRTATPAYASCEQLEGQRADPRDDLYALGCIAYELLAGRHPFEGKSATQARAEHLRPRRPPGLSAASWRALRSALAWRRARRPLQIGPWLGQLGVGAAAKRLPPSYQMVATEPAKPWLQRLTAAALLAIAASLVAALVQRGSFDWQQSLQSARSTLQAAGRRLHADLDSDSASRAAGPSPPVAAESDAVAANSSAARPPPSPASSGQSGSGRTPNVAAAGGGLAATGQAADPVRPAGSGADSPGAGTAGAAGPGVAFTSPSYSVIAGEPAARLVIRRTGKYRGEVRFVWWTEEDTAKANVDYAPLGRRAERIPRGADAVTIYVPIISNPLRHHNDSFYVALGRPGDLDAGVPSARATVTIDRGG